MVDSYLESVNSMVLQEYEIKSAGSLDIFVNDELYDFQFFLRLLKLKSISKMRSLMVSFTIT